MIAARLRSPDEDDPPVGVALRRHVTLLRRTLAVLATVVLAVAAAGAVADPPDRLRLVQVRWLLWALAGAAALDLITVMPVLRAMLRAPLRVFAIDARLDPLLRAHARAHLVAALRVAAVAGLGAALLLLGGRPAWLWIFAGTSLAGLAALWPTARRVAGALGLGEP